MSGRIQRACAESYISNRPTFVLHGRTTRQHDTYFATKERYAAMARRATLVMTATLALSGAARGQPVRTATTGAPVLFICEHGTVKSLIAKLLFDQYAATAGLNIRAESRGSAAETAVPAWMQANLRSDGFALGTWKPAPLTTADLR